MGKKRKRRRSSQSGWVRTNWKALVVLATATVTAFLVALALTNPPTAEASRAPRPLGTYGTQAPDPVTVAFVGDSYTGGSDMGGIGATGWPALLGASLGFHVDPDGANFSAQGGTGYLRKGASSKTFGERIDAVIGQYPDVIVVAGGANDAEQFTPAEVEAAASAFFARIASEAPSSRVVVVGPIYPRGNVIPQSAAARDAIFRAAAANGITDLVDPLPWFDNGAVEIGADRTHPTDAGHAEIARQMLAVLTPIIEAERAEQLAD